MEIYGGRVGRKLQSRPPFLPENLIFDPVFPNFWRIFIIGEILGGGLPLKSATGCDPMAPFQAATGLNCAKSAAPAV